THTGTLHRAVRKSFGNVSSMSKEMRVGEVAQTEAADSSSVAKVMPENSRARCMVVSPMKNERGVRASTVRRHRLGNGPTVPWCKPRATRQGVDSKHEYGLEAGAL